MRLVAARTAHLALHALVAAAGIKLLHTADEFAIFMPVGPDENRPDHLPGEARPIVIEFPAPLQDASGTLQMALLANPVAQFPGQPDRVDDGDVHAFHLVTE